MKKYINITDRMLCVEFEDHGQFLSRGQSVTNNLKTKNVPEGILVEDVIVKKSSVKSTSKKK